MHGQQYIKKKLILLINSVTKKKNTLQKTC